jgi:hypothetical protein
MRQKLKRFTEFANSLLPHETQYLLSIQSFDDQKKLSILERVDHNCRHINQFTPFDTSLDKRKYTNLKNWIISRLKAIDVDEQFEWMSYLERQITIDAITPEEEKKLLRAIRKYQHPHFFFTKFYELVQHYRHFLLIRMRFEDHELASNFVKQYQEAYQASKKINEQLHQASMDVVNQYAENNTESIQWEDWLTRVFYDEKIDGINRYLALIRLIFIGLNYGRFDQLKEKFDYIDKLFEQGKYYSKRLLVNYYSNRLLLHTKFQELDKAAYYGYLSIRQKTHDHLMYVNNLCAILLRQKKNQEALKLLQQSTHDMRNSKNFYNRIGFISFHVKCLNANGLYKNAENHAESFLLAYRKEVLQYRWHIFFTTYLETLLFQQKHIKAIRTIRKNHLLELDKKYQKKPGYIPSIPWYYLIAMYKEGEISWERLTHTIIQDIESMHNQVSKEMMLSDLMALLKAFLANDYIVLRSTLEKRNLVGMKNSF